EESVLSSEVELLGETLQKNGFVTAGLIANGFVSRAFGFDQGWTKYHNYVRMGGISAATNVYDEAIAWVEANKDQRFFLYLQTIDPHVPYEVARDYTKRYCPEEYTGIVGSRLKGDPQAQFSGDHTKVTERDYDWIRALYYGEVTYHDEHMGRLFEMLRNEGLLDDTLVIITNDHGEELDDH